MYLSCDKQTILTMEIIHLFSSQNDFCSFKEAVITSTVGKITFVVSEITFQLVAFTSSVVKITCVVV